MPELPDIVILARTMDQALHGRTITGVTVNQPRCLDRPPDEFVAALCGRTISGARQRGKWVLLDLDNGDILALNLGMGGEVCLHTAAEQPDPQRERVVLALDDGRRLWAHFWWFGQVRLVPRGDLSLHKQLSRLGPEPLAADFTVDRLAAMLRGRRGALKRYLLDQSFIAGIGNVYVQDILWHARLHPLAKAGALSTEEVARLHRAIRHVLQEGIRLGGGPREKDVWGNEGHYMDERPIGYRTGEPCPACGTLVQELRVGATTSYICPRCQPPPG